MAQSEDRCRQECISKSGISWILVLLTTLVGTSATATNCVMIPKDGPFPARVLTVAEQMRAHQTASPCGLVERAQKAFENRKSVQAGLMTTDEADAQGGTLVTGNATILVLPAQFANSGAERWNPNALELELFVFSQTGTLNDYYEEVSYGNFGVDGQVMDWVRVSGSDFEYESDDWGYGGGAGDFVLEVLHLNNDAVNYANFDNDGPDGIPNSGDDDGFVDQVFIVHPEGGGECGGDNLWSHQWYFDKWFDEPFVTNDTGADGSPIKINKYVMAAGTNCSGGMIDIGLFAHEFGHCLGIPDLYDTDEDISGDSAGLGSWGLMAGGNWNSTTSPAHMTAFTKHRLGWLNYFVVENDTPSLCLPPVETDPVAAQVWSYGMPTSEYFLVENRQNIGFDSQLAAEGLVIYHVDESVYSGNGVNADETHKAIDVECADAMLAGHVVNADDLDAEINSGDAGDVWCLEGSQRTFNAVTTPNTMSYAGVTQPISIQNITACNGGGTVPPDWICASYNVGSPSPVDVCIEDCASDNCNGIATCEAWWESPDIWIDNDGDGQHDLPALGVENKIWTRLHNLGPDIAVASSIRLFVSPAAMGLEWPTDGAEYLGATPYPVVEAGQEIESHLVYEYPEIIDGEGHYCIGAVIQQTFDTTFPTSAQFSNNIAQVNSPALFARAGSSPLSHGDDSAFDSADADERGGVCGGSFSKEMTVLLYDGYNPTGGLRSAEVRVGTHPNYDDYSIPPGWDVEFIPDRGPFPLWPGMNDEVIVRISSDSAFDRQTAHIPLTLFDHNSQEVIGGTTIDCTIDCFYPSIPQSTTANWTNPQGDFPIGPTVLVEWDPVVVNVNEEPERVMLYEVFRSSDAAPIEVLVDRVAIDKDPSTPKFQWFDDIPRASCPVEYTYRVRAVDLVGGAGEHSIPIVLACPVASVEVGTTVSGRMLEIFPNPIGHSSSTTVRFTLTEPGKVDLAIYSASGQRVRNLVGGEHTSGSHEVAWGGRDDSGRELPSGIYYCRIDTPIHHESQEIVRIR